MNTGIFSVILGSCQNYLDMDVLQEALVVATSLNDCFHNKSVVPVDERKKRALQTAVVSRPDSRELVEEWVRAPLCTQMQTMVGHS